MLINLLESMVPGGGVEPPRAEARRILSPLRLPVPPSRPCTARAIGRTAYRSPAIHRNSRRSFGVNPGGIVPQGLDSIAQSLYCRQSMPRLCR